MDIAVRPIEADEIDSVPLRCWPDRKAIAKLFARQGTIGMAAWDGNHCVAQLHCYRIEHTDDIFSVWPRWNRPWWGEKLQTGEVQLHFPVWCHACCHVGRTLETLHDELLQHVLRFAKRAEWDADRTHADISELDAVFLSKSEVEEMMGELKDSARHNFRTEAPEYRGRGIGTALCNESLRWAKAHGYACVVGMGAPRDMPECASHSGHLPWTTYARIGFSDRALFLGNGEIPEPMHPPCRQEIQNALASGLSAADVTDRMMVSDLNGAQTSVPGDA